MADTNQAMATARIDVVVDTDGITKGTAQANSQIGKFSGEAAKQFDSLDRSSQRLARGLLTQAETFGLTSDALTRYNIMQKTSGALQEDLLRRLDESKKRYEANIKVVNQYGLSLKQQTAAMRGVPAQITDIFTSLQGGQNPLTVLIQQGGQLKDMFGGVVPAASALASGLMNLVNPITLIGAALGVVVVGYKQGSQEATEFNKALITTGNYAGTSATELHDLAAAFDDLQGVTTGKAAEALTAVAATGKFTGDQLKQVAQAALEWQVATGTAVDETIKQFVSLADDPVKAILKLNETMHFLDQATLDQIKLFQKMGEESKATALAISTVSDMLEDRSKKITQNLGYMERAWNAVTSAAKEGWDAVLGIGREETATDQIKRLQQYQQQVRDGVGLYSGLSEKGKEGTLKAMQDAIDKLQVEANKKPIEVRMAGIYEVVDPKVQAARDAFHEREIANYTKEKKLVEEINKIQAEAIAAGYATRDASGKFISNDKRVDAALADAKKRFAPSTAGATAIDNSATEAALQKFKNTLTEENAALDGQTRLLKAEYDARTITVTQYYDGLAEVTKKSAEAEQTALQGQIAYLKQRDATGKTAIDTQRKIGELESQLAASREKQSAAEKVQNTERQKALDDQKRQIEAYRVAIDARTEAINQAVNAEVTRIGMGQREYELQQQIVGVYIDQAKALRELALQKDKLDPTVYAAQVEDLKRGGREQVEALAKGYDRVTEARADWMNGFDSAMANFVDNSLNVADQVSNIWSNAFDSMGDAIGEFVKTGKLDLDDLVQSTMASLAKLFANRFFAQLMAGSGENTGTLASLFSSNSSFSTGFAEGGPTPPGPKYKPVGVVHAGENVWSQEDVKRAGGMRVVEGMRRGLRGYANGGPVGVAQSPAFGTANSGIIVEVNNYGSDTVNTRTEKSTGANGEQLQKLVIDIVAQDVANGGRTVGAMKNRLNVQDRV